MSQGGAKRLGAGLLAAGLALALYLPSMRHGFIVYDDPIYVTGNRHVLQGFTLEGLRWSLTATEGGNWHPLTWWTHMAAVQIFGTWPGGHHLLNALLHGAAAAALVWALSGLTGALAPSLVVGCLFAAHPLHVESVAWVAERKDVVVALFWMLTLGAWGEHLRRPRPGSYLVALGFFGLALMGKPTAVVLPLALLLLDGWPLDRVGRASGPTLRRLLAEKAPFFLAAAALAIVSLKAQHDIGALGSMGDLPPEFRPTLAGMRVANALFSSAAYLGKAFWPSGLAVFYPHPAHAVTGWATAIPVILLGGITAAAVLLRRRAPWVPVGWAWYLLVLAPVIGIVQVGSQARADRYAYLPLIGVWIALCWSGREYLRRRPAARTAAAALAAAVLLALCLVTARQLGFWRDTASLFSHALEVTEDNYLAHRVLGEEYRRQGRFAEAEGQFRAALRAAPYSLDAYNRLGLALFDQRRFSEAAAAHLEAVRINPRYVEARNNLGMDLTAMGALREAEGHLREALRLRPGAAEIWANLGDSLARQGRSAEAADAYRKALELRPGFAPVRERLERLLSGGGPP